MTGIADVTGTEILKVAAVYQTGAGNPAAATGTIAAVLTIAAIKKTFLTATVGATAGGSVSAGVIQTPLSVAGETEGKI